MWYRNRARTVCDKGDKAFWGVTAVSGALIGAIFGGPIGAGIGAIAGYFAGKATVMSTDKLHINNCNCLLIRDK